MKRAQLATLLVTLPLSAQQYVDTGASQTSRRANDPAAVELFRDRGLGLFVHWGVDGALGGVISHSVVGASPDYVDRFFNILPGTFNPDRYQTEPGLRVSRLRAPSAYHDVRPGEDLPRLAIASGTSAATALNGKVRQNIDPRPFLKPAFVRRFLLSRRSGA
jgi:hypothetical protein